MSVMSVSLSSARVIVWVSLCVTFCLILIVICLMYVWCSVFPILSSQRVKSFSIWMLQKDEKSIKMGRHLPKWNPWWWHGGYQEGKHSLLFLFSSETSKILYVCVSPCWAEVVYTAKHLWHLKCVKAKQVLYGDLKHMFDTSRGWTWCLLVASNSASEFYIFFINNTNVVIKNMKFLLKAQYLNVTSSISGGDLSCLLLCFCVAAGWLQV